MDKTQELNELIEIRDKIINSDDRTCHYDKALNEIQKQIDDLVEEISICEAEANAESRMFERRY